MLPDEQTNEPIEEPIAEDKAIKPSAIIDRISKLRSNYEQATTDSRQEYQDIFNAYMGKMENVQNTPYETRENIPKLRTEIAYIKPFIYSGDPEVEFEGVGDEDKGISKIYEQIVNFRFKTIPCFSDKIESWVGQSVGFGTSHLKVIWRFETKTNPDGTLTPSVDEPDIEVPSQLDTYYNPIISNAKQQPCFIFRSVLPLDEVKNNPVYDYAGEEGLNRDRVEANYNGLTNKYDSSSTLNTDIPNAIKKSAEGMCEIYEYIDNERIQTICGDLVLRDKPNPYGFKPVIKLIHEPNIIPNRSDGLGVGQNTLGLGKSFYKMFNQMMTNIKLVNNPMFFYLRGMGINPEQFVAKPGGGIGIDNDPGRQLGIDGCIKPIQFPDIKQGAIELLTKLDDEHKRASGANDLVQGTASNDTLGQDQLAQANTSNRFELISRRFKYALAELADIILKMELQNLQSPDATILRIFPEEMRMSIFQTLIAEKDNVKYNVRIKGNTAVSRNKELEAKRIENAFNLAQNFLTDKEKRAMLRRILERQGEQNIDEIIGESNPMIEQQEQMMAMGGMQGEQPQQGMMDNSMGQGYAQ